MTLWCTSEEDKKMSLLKRLRKEREINEVQRQNQIESAKLRAFQQAHQTRPKNLKYYPYCGKQLP